MLKNKSSSSSSSSECQTRFPQRPLIESPHTHIISTPTSFSTTSSLRFRFSRHLSFLTCKILCSFSDPTFPLMLNPNTNASLLKNLYSSGTERCKPGLPSRLREGVARDHVVSFFLVEPGVFQLIVGHHMNHRHHSLIVSTEKRELSRCQRIFYCFIP